MPYDDSDMKIAGDDFEPVKKADEQESVEATARQLAQEKSNGNLSRARRLGAIMADEVSAIDGKTDPARETEKNHALPMQRRILLAFAVEVGLDAFLPNQLVAQTAQNIFYNTLLITAPSIYEDLQESGAFSFYYLCFRDGRQVERRVGETFAALCGRKGDPEYEQMGREFYIRFIGQVKHFADTLEFVREEG